MKLRKILSSFAFFKHLFYHIQGIDVSICKTIYANFCALPIKDAIKFPILVYQGTRIEEMGKVKFNCPIRRGILVIGKRMFYRGQDTVIINRGTIEIDGDCEIMGGTTIHVLRYCSKLRLGNNVMIGECARFLVDTEVLIGDYTRVTFGCLVIDSEFHFVLNLNNGDIATTRFPIHIGRYNWIGNSSVIKKGTITPDYTIVSNGSMLTKDYSDIPQYSILLGVPAKLKVTGMRRIYNDEIDEKLRTYFMEHPNVKHTNISISAEDSSADSICNDIINVHIH